MPRVRENDRAYIPKPVKFKVIDTCGGKCAHCGTPVQYGKNFTLEHVIPLNKGGSNDIANFVALCHDCNQEKSDDIVEPKHFYTHLPKQRLLEVQKLFETYMKSTKWLSYDTLFPLDQFPMTAYHFIEKPGKQKPLKLPVDLYVRKLRPEQVIDFMMLYGGRLAPRDKSLVYYNPEDVVTSHYAIQKDDQTLMVISAYIQNVTAIVDKNNAVERDTNGVYFDVYIQPDLPQTTRMDNILVTSIRHLVTQIQTTLSKHAHGTAIPLVCRAPLSDTRAVRTFQLLSTYMSRFLMYDEVAVESNIDEEFAEHCVILWAVLFQGSKKECMNIPDTIEDPNDLQKPLNDELALGQKIRNKPTHHKRKSQKKRRKQ